MSPTDTAERELQRQAIYDALEEIVKDILFKLAVLGVITGGLMGAGLPAWAIVCIVAFVASFVAES